MLFFFAFLRRCTTKQKLTALVARERNQARPPGQAQVDAHARQG
jgi:hypothetical protein